MNWFTVRDIEGLAALVEEAGILPFFRCAIPGWSLEEHIDPGVWFTGVDGPWEWKGRLAKAKRNLYGKLIAGKNAWVSLELYADLCNLRRDGYDFEGRCEDGLVPWRDQQLMRYMEAHAPLVSKAVRRNCGVTKGFDTSLTRLQMQTFICNQDFVYDFDRHGNTYGWGNALLTTPEKWLGEDYLARVGDRSPEASLDRLMAHMRGVLPWADEHTLRKLLVG